MSSVEEIQRKIDKWKELTSNLETIKEQMLGETSSTQFNQNVSIYSLNFRLIMQILKNQH